MIKYEHSGLNINSFNDNSDNDETSSRAPDRVLSDPALLFLYYRTKQILGIKPGTDALINLNEYIEKTCGASFIEDPSSYERLLSSREQIYAVSKFLTVNETYFFRESAHFELLSDLLPELIKHCSPLRICCAAVSTGCEAYSIAMLLDYRLRQGLDFDYQIDAFDVNALSIETAKAGRYTSNAFRKDGSAWKRLLDAYMISDNGEYIVRGEIRGKVRFFTFNIMRGLENQYDIIFFRNSLIYFSSISRLYVINNLAQSITDNGLLFLGVSETASAEHPLLASRYQSDVFYFQKSGISNFLNNENIKNWYSESSYTLWNHFMEQGKTRNKPALDLQDGDLLLEHSCRGMQTAPGGDTDQGNRGARDNKRRANAERDHSKNEDTSISCAEIAEITAAEEGKQNALNVTDALESGAFNSERITGSSLAACALYYLNKEDIENAGNIITVLERNNSCAFTKFLRGEYYLLRSNSASKRGDLNASETARKDVQLQAAAQKYYSEAAAKNKYFWPAFYRIACLCADGNKVRYEYKIRRAVESIELSKNCQSEKDCCYECFMGNFSPDYFLRILEKKLN